MTHEQLQTLQQVNSGNNTAEKLSSATGWSLTKSFNNLYNLYFQKFLSAKTSKNPTRFSVTILGSNAIEEMTK